MTRSYRFVTRWSLPGPPERHWAALAEVIGGERAMPGLEVLLPAPLVRGARVGFVVASPFGYRLGITATLTAVRPPRTIAATASGALRGHGELGLIPTTDGTDVEITWAVEPTLRWMRVSGLLLAPVFALAHDIVLRRIGHALRTASSDPRNAGNPGELHDRGRGAR